MSSISPQPPPEPPRLYRAGTVLHNRTMNQRRRPSPPVLAALLVAHIVVTALTWRDISRRSDEQLRGKKWFWRAFSALQMGNSAVYWLVGRKGPATPPIQIDS
jgi:hypothetical protein